MGKKIKKKLAENISFSSNIGRAIIRNGKVELTSKHSNYCSGIKYSALNAEKTDRERRNNVSTGLATNPFCEWREVIPILSYINRIIYLGLQGMLVRRCL